MFIVAGYGIGAGQDLPFALADRLLADAQPPADLGFRGVLPEIELNDLTIAFIERFHNVPNGFDDRVPLQGKCVAGSAVMIAQRSRAPRV